MRVVTVHGKGDVRVEDRPRPIIQDPADAILRVTTAAICGSDLHLYHEKVPGIVPGTPVGHEFVGIVEEVGPAVRLVEVGKRYVSSMYPACGSCSACMRHDWRNCPFWGVFGFGDPFGALDGGQAEYVRVPFGDMTLTEVPEDLRDEDVLFVGDILATAYTGVLQGGVGPSTTVAVVGAGPVGLLCVQCAVLAGAPRVFSVDLVPERLKQAEAFGAIPISAAEGDPSDALFAQNGNQGADVVIEAVGNARALETAWSLGRNGATLILIGVLVDEPWPISCGENWLRGLVVRPILGDPLTYRYELIRLIQAGRLRPAEIISHTLPLDEAPRGYAMFEAKEATKIVLKP